MTTQRNSPERAEMLAARAEGQRNRKAGYERMARKPRGFIGKWDPRQGKVERATEMKGFAAFLNRHTRKLHEHLRERFRRQAQWARF